MLAVSFKVPKNATDFSCNIHLRFSFHLSDRLRNKHINSHRQRQPPRNQVCSHDNFIRSL